MQTRAMLEDWAQTLNKPWAKPLCALGPATDRQQTSRFERPAFRHVDPAVLLRQVGSRTRERSASRNVPLMMHCACGAIRVEPESFIEALVSLLDDAIASTFASVVLVSVREGVEGDVLWQIRDPSGRRVRHPQHAFASAIVERHDGLLRFDSACSIGTRASIWLPENAARPRSLFSMAP